MADIQIAVIDEKDTQIALAVPGIQGPAGAISSGGSANQVFYKVSGTNYDAAWTFIGNANVDASAAIAGTKISPNFGSQTIATTGVFSHALGAAATPSLTFTGDLNTGIYSPGADQLAVATNGTGRLFVDASGNVGIGTASPAQKLYIAAASPYLQVEATSGTTGSAYYGFSNSTGGADIISTGPIRFAVPGLEAARITSAGLVGIGTSSPGSLLHVLTGASTGLTFQNTSSAGIKQYTDSTAANADYIINYYGGGASANGTALIIQQNGTPRFIVNSAGNVGIGSTSPQSLLHLETDGTALRIVRGSAIGFAYNTGTAATDPFRIQSNGGSVDLYSAASQPITFSAGTTEKVRIDSSGRLLIGTSNARDNFFNAASGNAWQFQVEGTDYKNSCASFTSNTTSTGDGPHLILARSRGPAVGSNAIVSSASGGDSLGLISFQGADGSKFVQGAKIEALVDGTPGAADMPGRIEFSTTADGGSSPTERMRIDSAGRVTTFATNIDAHITLASVAAGTSNAFFEGKHSSTGFGTGTTAYTVFTNGNVVNTNNSYGAISDIKLKENIVDANSQWNDLKALQVRNYNFKEGQTHTQIGLVAQEVQLVSPGLVNESPDRDAEGNDLGTVTKSVNYSVLYMKAVKALQEAMGRIESLESKVAALESA